MKQTGSTSGGVFPTACPARPAGRIARRLAALTVGVLVLSSGVTGTADAATSHVWVRHAAGNAAGEVWFNSGPHNLDRGYNSFTIKDVMCGDGWGIKVRYRVNGSSRWNWTGGVACDGGGPRERNVTIPGRSGYVKMTWYGCKYALDGSYQPECNGPVNDQVGRSDNQCGSRWMSRANGYFYNDNWAVSIRPTTAARVAGAAFTGSMWNALRACVKVPNDLTSAKRDSLYKQLWCHVAYAKNAKIGGGPTWDLEASRPNVSWAKAANVVSHRCNW